MTKKEIWLELALIYYNEDGRPGASNGICCALDLLPQVSQDINEKMCFDIDGDVLAAGMSGWFEPIPPRFNDPKDPELDQWMVLRADYCTLKAAMED